MRDILKKYSFVRVLSGCGVLFYALNSPHVLATNSATGTFTATIKAGTCTVAMTSGKSTISLGRVDANNISSSSINSPLLMSDADPQTLTVNCAGLPLATSTPTLTLSGKNVGTVDSSVFRSSGLGDDTSASLGIRVQMQQVGSANSWDNIAYMTNNENFNVASQGSNVNGNIIPVRFSMWCKPVVGQSFEACKETGQVVAGLNFTFNYK